MCEIDKYGFATVDYWNENIATFKNIFNSVKTFINFSETPAELFDLFQMYNADRLVFKQFPTTPQETTKAITQLTNYCTIFARTYQTKYNKLLATEKLEYDPIENYSMVESGTDTNTTDNTTNIGAQTNTSSIDNSTNYGEVSNNGTNSTTYGRTEENGQSANTKSGGQTDSRYTVPYDTSDEQLAEKTKTDFSNIKDSATNKVTAEEHTDSGTSNITIGTHTDTSKSTNSDTLGARIDTSNSSTTTAHEFKRSGNIGITTSQMMLQSERDIAMFNFMAIVAHDIIKLITICIYD